MIITSTLTQISGHRHKFDNEGSPVFIEKLGPVDVKGIVLAVPEDKIIHYQMWNQENDVKMYVCIFKFY